MGREIMVLLPGWLNLQEVRVSNGERAQMQGLLSERVSWIQNVPIGKSIWFVPAEMGT